MRFILINMYNEIKGWLSKSEAIGSCDRSKARTNSCDLNLLSFLPVRVTDHVDEAIDSHDIKTILIIFYKHIETNNGTCM